MFHQTAFGDVEHVNEYRLAEQVSSLDARAGKPGPSIPHGKGGMPVALT
jgi:hypothetical protein